MIKAVFFDCFGVLTANELGGSVPNKMLFDFIRDELMGKFKIGMLSNSAGNWLDELFELWQIKLFDATILSYEVGAVKPDPIIYLAAAKRLGVECDECIFVDDIEQYCTVAQDVGMKAIWHKDTNETINRIKELTGA